MRIVIDIDNTIVDYRQAVLSSVIRNQKHEFLKSGLTTKDSIISIKNFVKRNYGDDFWQLIQSEIYATKKNINFYCGVNKVIKDLGINHEIFLVSHKSKYGLKKAKDINILKISTQRIFNWIVDQHLCESIKSVIYCESFDEKIKMINLINPDTIIDDLDKVHLELKKSKEIKSKKHHILFKGSSLMENIIENNEIITVNNWMQISQYLDENNEIRK